ncbi:MAG: ECF transporter S component [Clostridia bacterium]|nr:ECF transporter S component [Clostridia bacterium]
MNRNSVRRLTLAAMMGAIAFVLMFLSFPTPLSPFAELDFSALPELIGGFILGPAGALEIITVKILLKLIFKPTSTAFTGELQAFLLSVAYVLPAVLWYRTHRTKSGALAGIIIGSVVSVVTAVFTNLYLIFPFYMNAFGMQWDAIIGMCSELIPAIHDKLTMVLYSIVPFNALSRVLTSVITMLLYKRISVPLKKLIMY